MCVSAWYLFRHISDVLQIEDEVADEAIIVVCRVLRGSRGYGVPPRQLPAALQPPARHCCLLQHGQLGPHEGAISHAFRLKSKAADVVMGLKVKTDQQESKAAAAAAATITAAATAIAAAIQPERQHCTAVTLWMAQCGYLSSAASCTALACSQDLCALYSWQSGVCAGLSRGEVGGMGVSQGWRLGGKGMGQAWECHTGLGVGWSRE